MCPYVIRGRVKTRAGKVYSNVNNGNKRAVKMKQSYVLRVDVVL
jgi:hypothetical protein